MLAKNECVFAKKVSENTTYIKYSPFLFEKSMQVLMSPSHEGNIWLILLSSLSDMSSFMVAGRIACMAAREAVLTAP
jgi:hypothetical protein